MSDNFGICIVLWGKELDLYATLGIAFIPMLYCHHQHFILNLIAQYGTIALKLDLKLYPYQTPLFLTMR
ncbi:hypothetical protein [Sulfuricurvum sp.]|uniref:hypothetical protein n=1 Tax=Sulfuricurvum sp. TaxID=2025608 RepID=UPI0019AA1E0A|nr:hypothetical protein [Sulfuricurvum sp.]MBD3805475.1 hypothetical protein [Sulfuricurvum sp.]